MKRIPNFSAFANKPTSGQLEYCLWTDKNGALYVQILRNVTDTKKPGTHSKSLFRASDYLDVRNKETALKEMRGLNPEHDFAVESRTNNDDAAFLKAILRHLFPS